MKVGVNSVPNPQLIQVGVKKRGSGNRESDMLDKISELVHKRDDTLGQMDLWEEASPELAEVLDDLRVHLR